MTNVLIGRRGATNATARNLRTALQRKGLRVRATPDENVRGNYKMVRWGFSDGVRFIARDGVLNERDAISNNANKLQALETMRTAGVSVPLFVRNKNEIGRIGFPVIGRTTHHQGGAGLKIINNRFQLRGDNTSTHWLEKIEIDKEYRVHVFDGEVIGVYKKVENPNHDGTPNQDIRNLANGWRFSMCDITRVANDIKEISIRAVHAVGLDFGAVDLVINHDRELFVLEVNSAPSLDVEGTIFQTYVNKIARFFQGGNTADEEEAEEEEAEEEAEAEPINPTDDIRDLFNDEPEVPADNARNPARQNNVIRGERTAPTQNNQERIVELLQEIVTLMRN